MSDIVLNPVSIGGASGALNVNLQKIEDKINDEILHLTGGNNVMQQGLDMNSNRLFNLPRPNSAGEPVIYAQLLELVAGCIGNASDISYQDPEGTDYQLDDFLDVLEDDVRDLEDTRVKFLSDITALSSLNTAALVADQQFYRGEFWPDTGVGAVNIKWKPEEPVANHNGGTIIDPAKISELGTVNKTFGTYFTPDTVSGNTGCFVAESSGAIPASIFGVVPDADCMAPIKKMASLAGLSFDFGRADSSMTLDATLAAPLAAGVSFANGDLEVTAPDDAYYQVFPLAGGNTFDNFNVSMVVPDGGQVAVFRPNGDDIVLKNSEFAGGSDVIGGVENHLSYLIQAAASGTQKNLALEGCTVTGVSYVHLKQNSYTSVQENWSVTDCDFYDIIDEGVGLNSPGGDVIGFYVKNNRFHSHLGQLAGYYALYIAIATCRDLEITGNKFFGSCSQCIHVEENIRQFTISGNSGSVDCDGGVIGLLENDVGGTMYVPRDGSVYGNTFTKTGTQKVVGAHGVFAVDNIEPEGPADRVSIYGNKFTGFDACVYVASNRDQSCPVYGNTAIECGRGFIGRRSANLFYDNFSIQCDVGVSTNAPRVFSNHTFVHCVSIADTYAILENPSFSFESQSAVASGDIQFPIIPLVSATRVEGRISVKAVRERSVVHYSVHGFQTSWDGSSLVVSTDLIAEPGGIQTFVENDAGNLSVRLFSSAVGEVDCQANILGTIVVG